MTLKFELSRGRHLHSHFRKIVSLINAYNRSEPLGFLKSLYIDVSNSTCTSHLSRTHWRNSRCQVDFDENYDTFKRQNGRHASHCCTVLTNRDQTTCETIYLTLSLNSSGYLIDVQWQLPIIDGIAKRSNPKPYTGTRREIKVRTIRSLNKISEHPESGFSTWRASSIYGYTRCQRVAHRAINPSYKRTSAGCPLCYALHNDTITLLCYMRQVPRGKGQR